MATELDGTLYRKVVVHARDAEDGETPTIIHVTEERNGFAVILTGYNEPLQGRILLWHYSREKVIEFAVAEAAQMMQNPDRLNELGA